MTGAMSKMPWQIVGKRLFSTHADKSENAQVAYRVQVLGVNAAQRTISSHTETRASHVCS